MLEIPESQVLAAQINTTLAGKTIAQAQAAASPHGLAWYGGDTAAYNDLLAGLAVGGALPFGGQVEIAAGQLRLLLQEGINARYFKAGEKLPERHQLLLNFSDGSALACTVQMYGGIMLYEAGTNDNPYYLAACSKPSPLTQDFSEEHFAALIRAAGPKLSLKALLATEQRIPGLGNGCLQDILFTARLNPQTKMSALREGQMLTLFDSVKNTLQAMTKGGGRDTEKDLFGNKGGYCTMLSNKTYGNPCPACGGVIVRKSYLGGNIYFCPNCQPLA